MSTALRFIPPRVPLTDANTGIITREWYLFFQGVFERVGGTDGPSTTDLSGSLFEDAGSGETNALLFTLEQEVMQAPPDVTSKADEDQSPRYEQYVLEALQSELAEVREQLANVQKELDALKQSPIL